MENPHAAITAMTTCPKCHEAEPLLSRLQYIDGVKTATYTCIQCEHEWTTLVPRDDSRWPPRM